MIRLIVGSLFLLLAVFIFASELIGFFRFKYVMNRMHAAGLGDTLGIMSVAIAVSVLTGSAAVSLKLALVVAFMMLTGPVVTHLISKVETKTHRSRGEYTEEDR